MTATDLLQNLKEITIWLFLALIGVLTWFFNSIYSEFKEMKSFFNKWRDTDFNSLTKELEDLKMEVKKVEFESKRYWSEHKNQMENNQAILLERLNHTNENNKAAVVMIKDLFKSVEDRMTRIENKIQ
jgi:hypothetical protein